MDCNQLTRCKRNKQSTSTGFRKVIMHPGLPGSMQYVRAHNLALVLIPGRVALSSVNVSQNSSRDISGIVPWNNSVV